GLFLAAEQDAADVGGPTPECGTKLFEVRDLIAGAAVDRRELSFHDPSSLLRVVQRGDQRIERLPLLHRGDQSRLFGPKRVERLLEVTPSLLRGRTPLFQ